MWFCKVVLFCLLCLSAHQFGYLLNLVFFAVYCLVWFCLFLCLRGCPFSLGVPWRGIVCWFSCRVFSCLFLWPLSVNLPCAVSFVPVALFYCVGGMLLLPVHFVVWRFPCLCLVFLLCFRFVCFVVRVLAFSGVWWLFWKASACFGTFAFLWLKTVLFRHVVCGGTLSGCVCSFSLFVNNWMCLLPLPVSNFILLVCFLLVSFVSGAFFFFVLCFCCCNGSLPVCLFCFGWVEGTLYFLFWLLPV